MLSPTQMQSLPLLAKWKRIAAYLLSWFISCVLQLRRHNPCWLVEAFLFMLLENPKCELSLWVLVMKQALKQHRRILASSLSSISAYHIAARWPSTVLLHLHIVNATCCWFLKYESFMGTQLKPMHDGMYLKVVLLKSAWSQFFHGRMSLSRSVFTS